jgi:hypothetical protein
MGKKLACVRSIRIKIVCLCCTYFFLFVSKLSAENWFSEYWQQFFWKAYESECFGVRTFVRVETGNHFKNVRALFLSEQFVYKASKDVAFEIHYSYIHGHPLSAPTWRWQQRLELEANKIFHLPCNSQIITRNRLEIRWREKAKPQPDLRFRHRAMFLVPLENVKPLKAFSLFNELFYDISRGYFDQDRICPCQLTFEVCDKIDLDVFLIIRMLDENKILRKSIVLGTQLNF